MAYGTVKVDSITSSTKTVLVDNLTVNGEIDNTDIAANAAIADTKLDTISTADKVSISALNIDGAADIGTSLADTDLFIVDDGATGTNRKASASRITDYAFNKISGDVTVSSSGAASISAGAVTATELATDAVTSDKILQHAVGTSEIAPGAVTNTEISASAAIAHSKLANITAASVLLGNASNVPTATALTGDLTVSSTGVTTLKNTGTAGTYTKVTTDAAGRVSAGTTLSATDIPTLTSAKISDFDTQVRTSRLDQMAAPTAAVSLNSQKITSLAAPTADSDAATKAYVDAVKQGLDIKDSVRAATTANITLSAPQTIDGVAVVAGDRVLVKDQSTASTNGIYVVAAGAWTRATDADASSDVTAGLFVFVTEGTVNADSGWVLTTNDAITLGTTALSFSQFSGAGQITAGTGLTKTGNTIDVVGTAGRIVANADSIDLASGVIGTPGTYIKTTVDTYGRVTSGAALASTDIPSLGNIANTGAIGTTANLPIITGTSGVLQAGSFGTAANTFCQGNDSRLSDTRTPTDGSVTNVKVATNAAIDFSKLASLTSGSILIGNASNVPTATAITGDITLSNGGVTAIGSGVIVDGDINASAAISHSKLASITSGSVLIGNASNVPTATAISGDITLSNTGVTAIASGVIVDADINASAAIADTKLATISTANKVSNSATTATSANTNSAIVARDATGNFSANTITANLTGTASTATNIAGGGAGTIPYNTGAGATTQLAAGASGQFLKSGGAAAPSWATLALTDMPDAAFKKSVNAATTADIGASTFASNVFTGYSTSVSLPVTTTLSSTTATTTSTAGIKVGAVISGNANIPAATVASITNATTFVMSAAATAAGTSVTTTFTNTIAQLTTDGVTLTTGGRILVKDQTLLGGIADASATAKHGIYDVTNAGSTSVPWVLTRAADADSITEIAGSSVNVDAGTVNGGETWKTNIKVTDTLNTTAMLWYETPVNNPSIGYGFGVLHTGTVGVGYTTGAGGAVTQITSRTTAVTLAKLCGNITLVNTTTTAGLVSTFTVTNSTVAANDSVIVNHVSGGTIGAYIVTAGGIAAGSFQISVYTPVAQATAAAPVIRFTVIKSAIA